MDIRVICIGDELLSGDTVNTNLTYIGGRLAENGYLISGEICVPDDEAMLRNALRLSAEADVVMLVGGLGPTKDDLTRPITSDFLGRKLIYHPELFERIRQYLGDRGRKIPQDAMEIQSMVPEGGTILPNHNGTAPGLMVEQGNTLWFLMPGPPKEMKPIFETEILPRIQAKGTPEWHERTFRVVGLGESIVEHAVEDTLDEDMHRLHLAYCIKEDSIQVKLSVPASQGDALLQACYEKLSQYFGINMLPHGCGSAIEYLGRLLAAKGMTICTAESCTGGGIAAAMTDIPGSSAWFHGAFVTYTNEWKHQLLGVQESTLAAYGAVSSQTVVQMLNGALAQGKTDLAMAVSGIAGPDGGTAEKPVGTVYVGIAGNGWRYVRRMHFNGLRDTVRQRTKNCAVSMMLEKLLKIK